MTAGVAFGLTYFWWSQRVVATAVPGRFVIENLDSYLYYYPMFEYAFRELGQGRFPFWNPYQHCGTPFFATAQHLLLSPLNVFFLFLPTAAALKATTLLHLTLGLVFTFILGRVFGLARPAAATAAAAFVFSPAVASLVQVPHHLYGAIWMPLALALTHLVLTQRRLRWTALLGATLAAQYLGGYPMFCLFSVYLVLGYALWWSALQWRLPGGIAAIATGAMMIAAAALLAALLSAPQLLPALELAQLSVRSLNALDINSVDPHFAAASLPNLLLQTLLPTPSRAFQFLRMTPAPGWIVLALIGAAAANCRLRRTAGFFAVFGLATYLIGLGRHTPLFALYFALPGSNLFRIPSRFFALTALPLAMLAGIGVDALRRAVNRPRLVVATLAAVTMLGVGLAASVHAFPDAINASGILTANWFEPGLLRRLWVGCVELFAIAAWLAVFLFTRRWRDVVVWTLPLVIYASLFANHYNAAMLPELDPTLVAMPPRVVEYLRTNQGMARTDITTPRLNTNGLMTLPCKSGMRYGLYADMDRENTYARRYAEYVARLTPPEVAKLRAAFSAASGQEVPQGGITLTPESANLALLDLMGTRFIIDGPANGEFLGDAPSDRFPLRFSADGVHVRENPSAQRRAFVVRRAEVLASDAVLDRLTDPAFDPRRSVVLEQPPGIALDGGPMVGAANIVTYEPQRVVIEASTPAAALLVLTDQYYPGWRATVDGEAAPILRADYVFRAVALPPGQHTVEFRFVPRSFYQGMALAVVGLLLLVASGLWAWHAQRRAAPWPATERRVGSLAQARTDG
ncbi:MAG: YfhO family protein [bacterium]